ncbi:hypothetical protein Tsubulata_024815 [Turnera subulata]|uniref:Uncharacterized protein n=1 Tax=Turnera subulata TaxID=218843 RepID=A0A9Q0J305_9ROSI|nr:hypothetical protein Tsubulata_024815 [Turnera subulata]
MNKRALQKLKPGRFSRRGERGYRWRVLPHPKVAKFVGLQITTPLYGMLVNAWKEEAQVLKEQVRRMVTFPTYKMLDKLNLIDAVTRLGIGYDFEAEVGEALKEVQEKHHYCGDDDLSTVSLRFRLLRQHGYYVSCDVFKQFIDANGNFKENLISDVHGLLSLYDASFLGIHGETILDDALEFTKMHLESMVNQLDSPLAEHVAHALKLPLQRNEEKHEQRYYISAYEKFDTHDEVMLRLAKLEFNLEELRDLTKWWVELDLPRKLPFARDKLVENFFWALGTFPEPGLAASRIIMAKTCAIFTMMDDVYDVHGTVEELELLTDAVERWDTSMVGLEDYMKAIFGAVVAHMEEIEDEALKDGRQYLVHYIKEEVKRQIRVYMKEQRWFKQDYVPTFEEYRYNGALSCVLLLFTFQVIAGMKETSQVVIDWLLTLPKIVMAALDICRLMDDVVTREREKKRGDVASSIECYMKQYEVSEEVAIEAINGCIERDWKDTNEEMIRETAIPRRILKIFLNYNRVMEVFYKDFDSFTESTTRTKEMMEALLVHPLPV